MTNFIIVNAARTTPVVKKASRITGIASRQQLLGQNHHNPYSPVPTITTEEVAIQQWANRQAQTTKLHMLYPTFAYTKQQLNPKANNIVNIGGATYQNMTGNSSRRDGYLTGVQASHFVLGSAKIDGASLTGWIAKLAQKSPDVKTLAPNLCKLANLAIALEAQITLQPSFINQADAQIETNLHRNAFLYMQSLSNSISENWLDSAPQYVLNTSLQTFSNTTLTNIVEALRFDMQTGNKKQQKQHPSETGLLLFGGEPIAYCDALLDSGILRQRIGNLFKEVNAQYLDVKTANNKIVEEVAQLKEEGIV
ncbi:MAG TPA: hypothetical protein VL995_02245 [Cellvibrio sp.]|nr:hypothetical protein [Cellvibrio sp.]